MKKQSLLNTRVNNVSMEEAASWILENVRQKKTSYVVEVNTDVVMKMEKDPYLRKIADEAEPESGRWETSGVDFQALQAAGKRKNFRVRSGAGGDSEGSQRRGFHLHFRRYRGYAKESGHAAESQVSHSLHCRSLCAALGI